jgi:chorismate synthase
VSEAQLMSDMEDFLEKNPDAAKNLLFEDKKFKSYLNSLIPVDPSDTDQYNAAIELLKQNKDSTGETIEIDYNEILLEGYKKMINNTFENSLVPVPESVSNNNKSLGDFPAATDAEIKTNKDKYESTDENVETETTETPEEKQPVTIAQQMLNTKRPSASGIKAYNKFNKKELRNALSSGEIDEEILKKYLVQIPGVSILEGEVKGLENVSARDFNSAMRKLQQETEINLGYNI